MRSVCGAASTCVRGAYRATVTRRRKGIGGFPPNGGLEKVDGTRCSTAGKRDTGNSVKSECVEVRRETQYCRKL